MDILERLNGVVDYIEEHLTDGEPLSQEAVAKAALMPAAQFYRLFPYIANVTVGEYIRRRRLTLAAGELLATDIKIIDCALKYGYECVK
jgi:AraC family transcriptional regulator